MIAIICANGTALWRFQKERARPVRVSCVNDDFQFLVPSPAAPTIQAGFGLVQSHTVGLLGAVRFITWFELE